MLLLSIITYLNIVEQANQLIILLRIIQLKCDQIEMEFPQNIQSLLRVDETGFIICNGNNYLTKIRHPQRQTVKHSTSEGLKLFAEILNTFGARSAKSQGLKQVITSMDRFVLTDQRIYIRVKGNSVLGFVKVGQKNLFYRDYIGNIKELKPTCILDIYVHQTCQRHGLGKEIFQRFLQEQNKLPQKLAYDRPSQKLIGFLKKHYGLAKYIPQNNNYVIFDKFFSDIAGNYVQKNHGNIEKRILNQKYQHQIQQQQPHSLKRLTIENEIQISNQAQQKQINSKRNTLEEKEKPKTSTDLYNKRAKADSQPHTNFHNQNNQNNQNQQSKYANYPEDSIQILKKQMGKQSLSIRGYNNQSVNGKDYTLNVKQNSMKIGYTSNGCPWAMNTDKKTFRTTSNAYGSHYHMYK